MATTHGESSDCSAGSASAGAGIRWRTTYLACSVLSPGPPVAATTQVTPEGTDDRAYLRTKAKPGRAAPLGGYRFVRRRHRAARGDRRHRDIRRGPESVAAGAHTIAEG